MPFLKSLITSSLILFLSSASLAQHICGLQGYEQASCCDGLIAIEEDQFSFIPPPEGFEYGAERSVVISVNYTGFTTEAMQAFDYAVDIWAMNLESNVPIIVNANFTNLGGGVLGSAGPVNIFRNFSGAPENDTWYPVALANKLAGFDLAGAADISCNFNSSFNWYFGTDGNTPSGQYDFVSVVLHELGHGLGFIGSANVSGSTGFIGQSGDPYIYDTFVETGAGVSILTLPNASTTLGNTLTGNSLYWNGPEGIAGNGGTEPRLYAPGSWNGGSSYSHLNESTYPAGNANSLMTPFLGSAEAIHDPGEVTYGIFVDMGWEVGDCAITGITASTQTACDPADNTFNQTISVSYELDPGSGLLMINGNGYPFVTNPQTIILTDLPADGQPVSVTAYFANEPTCILTVPDLFTAPEPCCDDLRLTMVDPDAQQITIRNYGNCTIDVSNFMICSGFIYENLGDLLLMSGSIDLGADESVTFMWPSWSPEPSGADMSLYDNTPDYSNPDDMLDFTQWGTSGNGQEAVAVAKGIWGAGDFVTGFAPYNYTGDGSQNGVIFWEGSAQPCSIDAVLPLAQTPCDGATNTYTSTLGVSFSGDPGTGTLDVNGQSFPVSAPPMLVVLTDLVADGNAVDVNISFSDNPACSITLPGLFTAPESCEAGECISDLNDDGLSDVQDLLLFLADIGCIGVDCVADFNDDGATDSQDLLLFLPGFGQTCN